MYAIKDSDLGNFKTFTEYRVSKRGFFCFDIYSAYVATSTTLHGVKIDGFLYRNST